MKTVDSIRPFLRLVLCGVVLLSIEGVASNPAAGQSPSGPSISSVTPVLGPMGTSVVVTGANFGAMQGASVVTFNGVPGVISTWSENLVTAWVPAGATSGPVVVTVADQSSGGSGFTVTDAGGSPQLAAPTANPPGGLFGDTQSVALSAFPGAIIRYTTNGSDPTSSSAIYEGPIVLAGSATLKARASLTSWSDSPPAVEQYEIDDEPPSIVASVIPSPNAAGWNNTPVTVYFRCTDRSTVTCPEPVSLISEGASQYVSRTATDASGLQASANVTVNIDLNLTSLSLGSPTNDSSTASATVALMGEVSDALSGVASASCNGTPATVTAGVISCSVALRVGLNSIVLQARDAAGNSQSRGARITRTATPGTLTVTPARRTARAGEVFELSVTTDVGVVTADAVAWSTTNAGIVSVTTGAPERLVAEAPGTATLTATVGSLTADVQVTVIGSGSWPAGEARWSIDLAPGALPSTPIYARRRTSNGPDLFLVESDSSGTRTLRALRADGSTLWTEPMPGTWSSSAHTFLVGDIYGAVLAPVVSEVTGLIGGLQRLGVSGAALPWHYQAQGVIREIYSVAGARVGNIAQGPDGTVYFVEDVEVVNSSVTWHTDSFLVGLDGTSGAVKFRLPVPLTTHEDVFTASCAGVGLSPTSVRGASVSSIAVGHDGAAYLHVGQYNSQWVPTCTTFGAASNPIQVPGSGTRSSAHKVLLMRVEANGSSSLTTLAEVQLDSPDFEASSLSEASRPYLQAGPLAFDENGVLSTWYRQFAQCSGTQTEYTCDPTQYETHVTRSSGGLTDHLLFTRSGDIPLEEAYPTPIEVIGDNGTIILKSGEVRSAIDASSWATIWSASADGVALAALDDGGVSIHDSNGTLTALDNAGMVASATNVALFSPACDLVYARCFGIDGAGTLSAISVPSGDPARFSFIYNGNIWGQRQPKRVKITGVFAKGHDILGFNHYSIRIVPANASWHLLYPGIFAQQTRTGEWWGTLGAGSSLGASCSGFLLAEPNRDRDVNARVEDLEEVRTTLSEDDLIAGLLQAMTNYGARYLVDPLPYSCLPSPSPDPTYNSNGFATGLLRSVGAADPGFIGWEYPGSGKPVPAAEFAAP